MKRLWRFIKWFASRCGWFEITVVVAAVCASAGLIANEGIVRNIFWGIALVFIVLVMLKFTWWGVKNIWDNFKKDDERVFDILKQDNANGH